MRLVEDIGRIRLSKHYFLRDFLHSEIAAVYGLDNTPVDPKRAAEAGSRLCELLLEPLHAKFGRIAIRSGYRSPQVNAFGNSHGLNCATNEKNRARHIWDSLDQHGNKGAVACIVIPWFADRCHSIPWQSLAWWIHDTLPYSELQFFPKLCAFNIGWHAAPRRTIHSYVPPRGFLTRPGMPNNLGSHADQYAALPFAQDGPVEW